MAATRLWRIVVVCLWLHSDQSSVLAQPEIDVQKLAGKWYPIGVVRDQPLKKVVYAYTIEPLSHEDFVLIKKIPHKRKCQEERKILHAFQKSFQTSDGKDVIRFLETDYDTYHIARVERASNMALFLYARTKRVSGQVKKQLKRQASKWGFEPKQIVYDPQTGQCRRPGAV